MIRYLYIDDEKESSVSSLADGLSDSGLIQVERMPISSQMSFVSLYSQISKDLNDKGYEGILLDMCLNGGGENQLQYSASPLAQQLRTMMSQGETREAAIILCSTDEKMRQSYYQDKASHDLYDYRFTKEDIATSPFIAQKMAAIGKAYTILREKKDLTVYDIIGHEKTSLLDDRVFSRFENHSFSAYDIIDYLIKQVFNIPGILIDDELLAARLGVDIEKTPTDAWQSIKQLCKEQFGYSGLLSEGWELYWTDKMYLFFKEKGVVLATLSAQDRVTVVEQITGVKGLIVANPIRLCTSTYYDTVCMSLHKPMYSREGYEVCCISELKPWQEKRYVSLYAIQSGKLGDIVLKAGERERAQTYVSQLQTGK